MPDNVLKLVLLGGSDPKPTSRPIVVTNPLGRGGLLRPQALANRSDLLLYTNLTFHGAGLLATATVRCEPQVPE